MYFSYNKNISHVYIFNSRKSVEQQEGGYSKTVPNLSISDLKMTHLCDITGEALLTILTYYGEDQKSKWPIAFNSEDMRVSATYK